MDTKLTLKLDVKIIEKAKIYAAGQHLSLSRLIENYLSALTGSPEADAIEISPFVKSIATGSSLPTDLDYKSEYSDRLLEK